MFIADTDHERALVGVIVGLIEGYLGGILARHPTREGDVLYRTVFVHARAEVRVSAQFAPALLAERLVFEVRDLRAAGTRHEEVQVVRVKPLKEEVEGAQRRMLPRDVCPQTFDRGYRLLSR